MGELRLHAISVHDVRDMFGADADLAAELRKPGYRCSPIALGSNTDPYQRRPYHGKPTIHMESNCMVKP
mgnify:CR=1 FL=1